MEEARETKRCPYCAEEILAVAKVCKHCRSRLDEGAPVRSATHTGTANNESLGVIAVGIPVFAAILTFFWVGNMTLLQGPSSKLALISVATIISTAILIAVEAGNVGAGSAGDVRPNGRTYEGPAAWLIMCALFWAVGFPYWFFRRARYGLKNLGALAICAMVVYCGVTLLMWASIQEATGDLRDGLREFQMELEHFGGRY